MIFKEFRKTSGNIYARVITDPERKLISDTWFGEFETQENFRNVLRYISEEILKHSVKFWLADLRDMQGSFDPSSEWLGTELMPEVISFGLLKEAVVVPKDVFARLSAKDTIKKILNFEITWFDNIMKAEEWLMRS